MANYEPVRMHHRIEFTTIVPDDFDDHQKIAETVIGELERLAPLMVRERMLRQQLEEVQAEIARIRNG